MKHQHQVSKKWGGVQVPVEHYFSDQYLSPHRFLSLQAQLRACCQLGVNSSILEIGIGSGFLTVLLRSLGYSVHTIDFDPQLRPDINARLPELPLLGNCLDLVCAFEVLEHMPFELAKNAFKELCRVSRKRIILSVPNQKELGSLVVKFDLIIFDKYVTGYNLRKPLGRLFSTTEHYWEIGFDGIKEQDVINLAEGSQFVNSEVFFVSPYFQFFIFDRVS